MLSKTIKVGDKEVAFRSSATIPRLYRAKFKRDIFKDLSKLESSYKDNSEAGSSFAIEDLEIFENVAYIMAYHADHNIPEDIDDWLDQFEMFSIYEVLPEILELFLLRCAEIDISIAELDLLTIGMVMDIWTDKGNDGVTYDNIATQEDFDKF